MKKAVAICLFVVTGVCLQAQTLSWDLMFLKTGLSGAQETLPVDETIMMKNEENFQITLTPAADCFCYVVLYDSARKISVLHDQPLKGTKETNIGPFPIEPPKGKETLYVIMSLKRQTELENLIKSFNNDPSRQNAGNLRDEVVSLQRTTSTLGEPPVLFIASAATVRGKPKVTRFSEKDIYVRTIAISH